MRRVLQRKMQETLLVGSLTLLAAGCAAIFSSGPDPVDFRSDPAGADIIVNGQKLGETPVTLQLEPSKTYTVTFHRTGFHDVTTTLTTHVQAGWVVLDILTGLLGVAVDAATGEWKAFDSGQHYVELRRVEN